jgi:hypothetical protein
MRRFLIFHLLFFFAVLGVAQIQNAVVKRNTYLREGPSGTEKKIILLKAGDELELIDPEQTNDYYHVRTLDGEEGFAYSRNVTVKEAPEKLRTELAAPSGKPAEEVSSDWEKPAPKKTTFHGQGGNCPWNGDNSDPDTFVHKNRADTAVQDGIQYHDVTWAAIAHLKYPVAKPLRKNWTDEQIAEITPFEGAALRTTGYLVAFKPQNGGSGEGTNCHLNAASDTDTHMALVEGVGDAEKASVVIESGEPVLWTGPATMVRLDWAKRNAGRPPLRNLFVMRPGSYSSSLRSCRSETDAVAFIAVTVATSTCIGVPSLHRI